MQDASLISGTVYDVRGTSVAGARVYFTRGPGSWPEIAAISDSNGRFILSAPVAGTYCIEAIADGFAAVRAVVTVEEGRLEELDLKLGSGS